MTHNTHSTSRRFAHTRAPLAGGRLPCLTRVASAKCIPFLAALTLLVGASIVSHAGGVPSQVNYQGRVTDSSGLPFTGTTNLSFSVYASPTNDVAVWGPQTFTNPPVTVVDGFFSVVLGQDTTSRPITDAFTNSATWVETVCGTHTNQPRQQILSVPYAVQASHVSGAANYGMRWIYWPPGSSFADWTTVYSGAGSGIEIITHGRPVFMSLSGNSEGRVISSNGSGSGDLYVGFFRDETNLVHVTQFNYGSTSPDISQVDFDAPAGAHVYDLKVKTINGTSYVNAGPIRFSVMEMW